MPGARVYLVTYDISSPKRWRRIYTSLKRVGERQQLSVFTVILSPRRARSLERRLRTQIDPEADKLLFVDLGHVGSVGGRAPALQINPVTARIL